MGKGTCQGIKELGQPRCLASRFILLSGAGTSDDSRPGPGFHSEGGILYLTKSDTLHTVNYHRGSLSDLFCFGAVHLNLGTEIIKGVAQVEKAVIEPYVTPGFINGA